MDIYQRKELEIIQNKMIRPSHQLAQLIESLPIQDNLTHHLLSSKNGKTQFITASDDEITSLNTIAHLYSTLEKDSINELHESSSHSSKPLLRYDCIIDEYQIYETKIYGADSLFLPIRYLDFYQCQYLIEISREFNMEPFCTIENLDHLNILLNTDAKIVCLKHLEIERYPSFMKILKKWGKGRLIIPWIKSIDWDIISKLSAIGCTTIVIGNI